MSSLQQINLADVADKFMNSFVVETCFLSLNSLGRAVTWLQRAIQEIPIVKITRHTRHDLKVLRMNSQRSHAGFAFDVVKRWSTHTQ